MSLGFIFRLLSVLFGSRFFYNIVNMLVTLYDIFGIVRPSKKKKKKGKKKQIDIKHR